MINVGSRLVRGCASLVFLMCLGTWPVRVQAGAQSTESPSQHETDARIAALDKSLQETRAELAETRQEIRQLRTLLEEMNKTSAASPPSPAAPETQDAQQSRPAHAEVQSTPSTAPLAEISTDDWQVLKTEVQEQAQEKVESGSKYRLKLWGLALFNVFDVSGSVDNLDVPTLALPRYESAASGSVGGSVRQSVIGLTGTGPDLLGARTSADLQMDFFGGLPSTYGGGASGLFRLRLARLRLDWQHVSVIGGLDAPLFSPNSPTTFMSVAEPAFATAGNLWTWAPTIRVERRFDTRFTQIKVEGGLLAPSSYVQINNGLRQPTPGESSRQPVYAVRLSVNGTRGDRPAALGVSGIYFPQRFPGGVTVSGWGSVVDWRTPLLPHTELSGEFFVGKGLDSFGGVPAPRIQSQDYNEYFETAAPRLAQATMTGGWSQLKISVDATNEFNVAVGVGDRNSGEFAQAAALFPSLQYLAPRNEMLFVNYIFRPRSDLLFSPEYRRLRTYPINGAPAVASQVGIAAGFLF
jgi:hypothetical protein